MAEWITSARERSQSGTYSGAEKIVRSYAVVYGWMNLPYGARGVVLTVQSDMAAPEGDEIEPGLAQEPGQRQRLRVVHDQDVAGPQLPGELVRVRAVHTARRACGSRAPGHRGRDAVNQVVDVLGQHEEVGLVALQHDPFGGDAQLAQQRGPRWASISATPPPRAVEFTIPDGAPRAFGGPPIRRACAAPARRPRDGPRPRSRPGRGGTEDLRDGPLFYSHSMVAGGFELMSYVTRFTPLTSLMIRVLIRPSTSAGKGYQSAVIPSREVTAPQCDHVLVGAEVAHHATDCTGRSTANACQISS